MRRCHVKTARSGTAMPIRGATRRRAAHEPRVSSALAPEVRCPYQKACSGIRRLPDDRSGTAAAPGRTRSRSRGENQAPATGEVRARLRGRSCRQVVVEDVAVECMCTGKTQAVMAGRGVTDFMTDEIELHAYEARHARIVFDEKQRMMMNDRAHVRALRNQSANHEQRARKRG